MSNALHRCRTCGSANVWILDWTDPNTHTVVDGEPYYLPGAGGAFDYAASLSHSWCDACGEHREIVVWPDGWATLPPVDAAELAAARAQLRVMPRHQHPSLRPVVVIAWSGAGAAPQLLTRWHAEPVGTVVPIDGSVIAVVAAVEG